MVPFRYRDNGGLLQGNEGFNKVSLTFHSDESATHAGATGGAPPNCGKPTAHDARKSDTPRTRYDQHVREYLRRRPLRKPYVLTLLGP